MRAAWRTWRSAAACRKCIRFTVQHERQRMHIYGGATSLLRTYLGSRGFSQQVGALDFDVPGDVKAGLDANEVEVSCKEDSFVGDKEIQVADEELKVVESEKSCSVESADAEEDTWEKLCKDLLSQEESESKCLEAFKAWIARGNTITPEDAGKMCDELYRGRQFRGAIRILEYIRDEKLCELTRENSIRELTMASREYGASVAERVFTKLPESMKTEELIATFIVSLLKVKAAVRASKWLTKLKLSPTTSELCAAIMDVHIAMNSHEQVLKTYKHMKKAGIEPKVRTCCVLLKYQDRVGERKGLNKRIKEILEKVDIETADELTLNRIMEAYGYLGNVEKVDKAWEALRRLDKEPLEDSFKVAITAYGRLGEIEKAEKVMEDRYARAGSNPYFELIDVYARAGKMEEAEKLMKEKVENDDKRGNFYPYNALITGYLMKNEINKALKKLEEGYKKNGVSPSYETVKGLLPVFEEKKDVRSTMKLLNHYLGRYSGDVSVLNGVLKVFVAAKIKPNNAVLKNFIVIKNEETEELLKKVAEF